MTENKKYFVPKEIEEIFCEMSAANLAKKALEIEDKNIELAIRYEGIAMAKHKQGWRAIFDFYPELKGKNLAYEEPKVVDGGKPYVYPKEETHDGK